MNTAPVGYTCPDIDRIKDNLNGILKEMHYIYGKDKDVDYYLDAWGGILEDIAFGRLCDLEDLRDAK